MPHFVIEHSEALTHELESSEFVRLVHEVAVASEHFDSTDIKVCLVPVTTAWVAGKSASFVHITVYLLSGRSPEIKKALTQSVVDALADKIPSAVSISMNAIDMDRETYSKIVRL